MKVKVNNMNKAEEILRTYIDFDDVNGSNLLLLLPLTVIDAMEEYATQCQEDMADKKYTEEDLHTILRLRKEWYSHTDKNVVRDFIQSLNKQD